MIVLIEEGENSVMSEMKDGQIAVVTAPDYAGRIVQKYGDDLIITLGGTQGSSWSRTDRNHLPVRILPPGTKLEI